VRAPWLSLPAESGLWTLEADLPAPCPAGDTDSVPGIQSGDVLRERDCLAVSEPALRLQLKGWMDWWRDNSRELSRDNATGADNGKTELGVD
jgi:hypothetical protein